MASEGGGENQK